MHQIELARRRSPRSTKPGRSQYNFRIHEIGRFGSRGSGSRPAGRDDLQHHHAALGHRLHLRHGRRRHLHRPRLEVPDHGVRAHRLRRRRRSLPARGERPRTLRPHRHPDDPRHRRRHHLHEGHDRRPPHRRHRPGLLRRHRRPLRLNLAAAGSGREGDAATVPAGDLPRRALNCRRSANTSDTRKGPSP